MEKTNKQGDFNLPMKSTFLPVIFRIGTITNFPNAPE